MISFPTVRRVRKVDPIKLAVFFATIAAIAFFVAVCTGCVTAPTSYPADFVGPKPAETETLASSATIELRWIGGLACAVGIITAAVGAFLKQFSLIASAVVTMGAGIMIIAVADYIGWFALGGGILALGVVAFLLYRLHHYTKDDAAYDAVIGALTVGCETWNKLDDATKASVEKLKLKLTNTIDG